MELQYGRYNSGTPDQLCKRCHLLKHHNFLVGLDCFVNLLNLRFQLNVNVCPVDYAAMMSHLKLKEEALVGFKVKFKSCSLFPDSACGGRDGYSW